MKGSVYFTPAINLAQTILFMYDLVLKYILIYYREYVHLVNAYLYLRG